MKDMLYRFFIAVAYITIGLGLATMLPWSTASSPSVLGYRSLCTASPISTFMTVVFGVGIYIWANHTFRGKKTS
jgi:hypothetical protein